MPEGHSVHRIAARFREAMVGRAMHTTSPQGRFVRGAELLSGRVMEECYAVGKQMFTQFDGDLHLRVHLGIYGAWDFSMQVPDVGDAGAVEGQTGEYAAGAGSMGAPRAARLTRVRAGEEETAGGASGTVAVWPPAPVGAVRVRLLTERVCADLRGPTVCEVLTPGEAAAHLERLGPDPAVDGRRRGWARFHDRAAHRRTPIGSLLMDQTMIAGIGNIYRAEMLFRAGIDPYMRTADLAESQLRTLWDDWCRLLPIGIETGVIVTRTDLRGSAKQDALDSIENRHHVYGRAGQACRVCATPISLAELQGRKLYWCAGCQRR
ncbi:Fpg/Nei family DNA glycosylase [Brevibacterium jeotgali]|uniref:DNA-(apurinic or apyrimidinic site) lyase n=1 Tax=Brevibacterium jeotgali TaxID=1262550 RepID=A0A2H1L6T7_9MICO|nr:DNA-formamidopyrimidine glycosylase family protein [Brevibacterium jeotgali]TWC02707.1 endonuclease-8/formamidopyrimidine-DNA glycosylase [Brevibacterium jeotgali]SMY12617.1 endonuclease-8 [Brevibacterium jeotgali]